MEKLFIAIIVLFYMIPIYAQIPKMKPLKEKNMIGNLEPTEKKGKWGYSLVYGEKTKKFVIDDIFEEARSFVDSIAIVKYEGKYGILHRNGLFKQLPQYDEIRDYDDGFAYFKIGSNYGYFDLNGNKYLEWTDDEKGNRCYSLKGIMFKMLRVPAGAFFMGVDEHSCEGKNYDCPKHFVEFHSPFYIGEIEVTQMLWRNIYGNNPSKFIGDNKPVESVNWNDCQEFLKKLNNVTRLNFRLPTEAEWEYASSRCMDGAQQYYSGSDDCQNVAWVASNSTCTNDVKTKQPNALGIYDMTGNVQEWCSDWYNSDYYNYCPEVNPQGATTGVGRVRRGGSWKDPESMCYNTYRQCNATTFKAPWLGFRLAMDCDK